MGLKVPQPIKRVMGFLREKAQSSDPRHGHDHAQGHGSQAHRHSYTEEELLARTEEFNRNAELYWKKMESEPGWRTHAMNKPFSATQEAPMLVYRLGLVLTELHLGPGHTVLDFGAGSCWLSSFINRLRCRTISIDVSPTALKLGGELFKLDPRHRLDLEPQFLPYDGYSIPLPSESVDRVVCFDSFHHVPNQDKVLSEIYRVLKVGGRAVFAEPGEGHSHTAHSISEMERYGVLENDLNMSDLIRKCKNMGFAEVLIKPYPDASAITFSSHEYLRFKSGETDLYPMHLLKASLRNFLIFVLMKGDEIFDSRNPKALKADIKLADSSRTFRGRCGSKLPLMVKIKNTGDTIWLHEIDPCGGYVMLAGHLYNDQRDLIALDFFRIPLPKTMAPGDSLDLRMNLPLPFESGRYFVKLDMVDEWVTWFEERDSPTTELEILVLADELPDTRSPGILKASIELLEPQRSFSAKCGSQLSIPVRITNTGNTIWLHEPMVHGGFATLGGHLYDDGHNLLTFDFFRTLLPKSLGLGEGLDLVCKLEVPSSPGRYFVELDMVDEHVRWFAQSGSPTTEIEIIAR